MLFRDVRFTLVRMSPTSILIRPSVRPSVSRETQQPELWNVVLIDDDDHTYDYVITMLATVCRHSPQHAFRTAQHVDERGRAIVYTAHKELAELKVEQIRSFGGDPLVASCTHSMRAFMQLVCESEPADA